MKDIELDEKRNHDATEMRKAKEKFQIEWLDKKWEAEKKEIEQNKKLEEAIRLESAKNAKIRQRRAEINRAKLPDRIKKAKEIEEKKWAIVRKFAMRWLEKVRRRMNAPKDLLHESVWIGKSKGVLDDTLKYLKEISGYEKLDDFILNIIKLKRQIQHQIELEEAEEAAALKSELTGGAGAGEGEGEDAEETASTSILDPALLAALELDPLPSSPPQAPAGP